MFASRQPKKGAKGPFTFSININVCVYNGIKFCSVPIVMQKLMHRTGDFPRLLFHYHKHNISVDLDVDSNAILRLRKATGCVSIELLKIVDMSKNGYSTIIFASLSLSPTL